ncbi:MAG: hypothetical protein WC942_11560 [Clostridia bacterium]|jgi:hypothetical protein
MSRKKRKDSGIFYFVKIGCDCKCGNSFNVVFPCRIRYGKYFRTSGDLVLCNFCISEYKVKGCIVERLGGMFMERKTPQNNDRGINK